MEDRSTSRRKSYTAQFKLEVVEVAKEKGNREAGRLFSVAESSVREWRKAEIVLKCLHSKKRAMRYRRCLWPTIERKRLDWVDNERAKDFPTKKHCLKKNAVPSQNLPVSSCKQLVGPKDKCRRKQERPYLPKEEGALGVIPHHDEHEMCFEYVDVAEGQFASQEPGLHTENVDSLLIKQEAPTEQNCEIVSENVTAGSVTGESERCFENVDTSDKKEYGTCFKIIDVRSIKEEPADEGNVTEDPFAMGEIQILDASSIKEEHDIKQEHETQFMNNEEIEGGVFKNVKIAAEQSAENMIGTQIKEEQPEIEEDKSFILATENQFTAQYNKACSVNVSLKGDQLLADCLIATVMVKEEELESPEAKEVLSFSEPADDAKPPSTEQIEDKIECSDKRLHKCEMCGKTFKRFSSLKSHTLFHKEQYLYECRLCPHKFKLLRDLQKHSLSHVVELPFKCDICGRKFKHFCYLKQHSVIHKTEEIGKQLHECRRCGKTFMKRVRLKTHVCVRTGEHRHTCKVCGKAFQLRFNLKKHYLTHDTKSKKCQVCHKSFRCLKIHALTHLKNRPHECKICNNTFASLSALKSHIGTHTKDQTPECELCGKTFTTLSSLKTHIRVHTGERPYECKICSKDFRRSSLLKEHERIHTGERPYQCRICNKTFMFANTFRVHARLHSDERKFKCKECGKGFQHQSSLKKHSVAHTGNKSHNCVLCNERFQDLRGLKKHILVHMGEEIYECKICDKTFKCLVSLKSHILIHTGERPYSCGECKKTFRSKSTLQKHSLIHSKIGDPNECSICKKSFRMSKYLKIHSLIHQWRHIQ